MNNQKGRTLASAMLFETGLGFVGVLLAWLAGIALQPSLVVTQDAVLRGLVACLPMLVLLGAAYELHWAPLDQLRRDVELVVRELFAHCGWIEFLLISLAAGLGEEILFRGALQPLLVAWTNPWIGIAAGALLFGLAHSLSTTYFVAATLIGLYFGWLAWAFDDLVAPIVAHSLYDFIALLYIQHRSQTTNPPAP